MKRATLERNLKEVIRRLNSAFLPVTILKVFVHGSFFRGEELPGDLDVVILLKVKDEFEYWHRMFSDLSKCYDRIVDCYMKGMTVSEAFSGPLLSEIRRRNIPLDWIVVMSWSDIFGQTSPYIPLFMNWEKIVRKILTKGMKGVHIQFVLSTKGIEKVFNRVYRYNELPLFEVWSNESPSECVLEPSDEEFEIYLKLENEKLHTEFLEVSVIKEIGEQLLKECLSLIPKEKHVEIAFKALTNTPKYEISEEKLREVLRRLSIPEDKILTVKGQGMKTWYKILD